MKTYGSLDSRAPKLKAEVCESVCRCGEVNNHLVSRFHLLVERFCIFSWHSRESVTAGSIAPCFSRPLKSRVVGSRGLSPVLCKGISNLLSGGCFGKPFCVTEVDSISTTALLQSKWRPHISSHFLAFRARLPRRRRKRAMRPTPRQRREWKRRRWGDDPNVEHPNV